MFPLKTRSTCPSENLLPGNSLTTSANPRKPKTSSLPGRSSTTSPRAPFRPTSSSRTATSLPSSPPPPRSAAATLSTSPRRPLPRPSPPRPASWTRRGSCTTSRKAPCRPLPTSPPTSSTTRSSSRRSRRRTRGLPWTRPTRSYWATCSCSSSCSRSSSTCSPPPAIPIESARITEFRSYDRVQVFFKIFLPAALL